MFKKLFFSFLASFSVIFSISASKSSDKLNDTNDATKMSLSYVSDAPENDVGSPGSSGEDPENLVDGTNKKWCSRHNTSNHFTIVLKSTTSLVLDHYYLATANYTASYPKRNWQDWNIYGGNSSSGPWTQLVAHTGGGCSTTEDYKAKYFDDVSDKTKPYSYFKIYFTTQGYESNNYIHQVSELTFYGNPQYTITYKDKGGADFSGTHESGYPTTHTYNYETTLKGATKDGQTFLGWFASSDCSGSPITSLGATSYSGNITLYAKWISSSLDGNAKGGYRKDGSNKIQIVMFGFTFLDFINLNDTDSFGIYIYSNSEGTTPIKTFSSSDISSLKSKEGRFYCVYDCASEGATYYVKAYVISNSKYIYSSLISATGNFDKEYTS